MEKKVFLLLMVLGVSIVYSTLCFLVGPSGQQFHEAFCVSSFHSCVYLGVGFSFLFFFLLTERFFLLPITFIPNQFAHALFRPPQRHS